MERDAETRTPPPVGENSLTLWGDKGGSQIVCDYGAAETFMHYLAGRFGVEFLTALHRDPDQVLASVRKLTAAAGADVMNVIHDWAAMIALDGVLDRGYTLAGGQAARYRTATLSSSVDCGTRSRTRNRARRPTARTTFDSP